MNVYLVWHTHHISGDQDDEKLIGVYSTRRQAESAIDRSRSLPGFRDHREGFEICPYEIDQDHWTDGFVTMQY